MLSQALFTQASQALLMLRGQAQRLSATRKLSDTFAGQGLVEYALILVLVAVVVIVVLTLLGPALGNTFSNIVCGVLDAQNAACN